MDKFNEFNDIKNVVESLVHSIMNTPKTVKVKLFDDSIETELPKYETEFSAGMDLRSTVDTIIVRPNQTVAVPTNLCFSIPRGYEVQIRPRSGLALKSNVGVLNSPGTIDSDYRGEIKVLIHNFNATTTFTIRKGDRIAQAVLSKVETMEFEVCSELDDTARGSGGFGSTKLK